MKAKDILNYKKLSLLISGNEHSIRKERCPKKYMSTVKEIEEYVEYYINKNIQNE